MSRPTFGDVEGFLGDRVLRSGISSPTTECRGPCSVDAPASHAVTFIGNERYFDQVLSTEVVLDQTLMLIAPTVNADANQVANVIVVANPRLEFARVVARFFLPTKSPRISPTAVISSAAKIGRNVSIGSGVVIGSATIGDFSIVADNSVISDHVVIGVNCAIGPNCSIGQSGFGYERDEDGIPVLIPHLGGVRIGDRVDIGANSCIDRGTIGDTVIEDDVKIDNLVHIAHNVVVEAGTLITATSFLGGSARVGRNSWIAPNSSIINGVSIGRGATVGIGAVVIRDVKSDSVVAGNPARELT